MLSGSLYRANQPGDWPDPLMTAKTHRTAVALIPPEDVWEPIQAIRRRYDRHINRWMPHVTLVYPFRPRGLFDEAGEKLREKCRAVEPFELSLAEFRHFDHGHGRFTLWLAPRPEAALTRLQAVLESAVPDCADVSRHRDGYTPHLSVGQVRGDDAMIALKVDLQASWQRLTFPVRHVSVIWRGDPPDDIFRVDRHIKLGD